MNLRILRHAALPYPVERVVLSNARWPSTVTATRLAARVTRIAWSLTNSRRAWPVMATRSNARSKPTKARPPWPLARDVHGRACASMPSAGAGRGDRPTRSGAPPSAASLARDVIQRRRRVLSLRVAPLSPWQWPVRWLPSRMHTPSLQITAIFLARAVRAFWSGDCWLSPLSPQTQARRPGYTLPRRVLTCGEIL